MKPFDLEKALAGKPVKDVAGNKRYIFKHPEAGYLVAYGVDDINICCNTVWHKEILPNEFTMWQEPRPRVQLDLPAPLEKVKEGQRVYLLNLGSFLSPVSSLVYDMARSCDYEFFKNGGFFATKEDAQEWLDAMRNARR